MSYRKLDIDGEVWNYVIGKAGVKIKSPNDKSTWVENYNIYYNVASIKGDDTARKIRLTYDDNGLAIGPGEVRKYIDKHLRGKL